MQCGKDYKSYDMDIGVLSDFNAHISKDLSRVMVIDVPTLSKENNLKVL